MHHRRLTPKLLICLREGYTRKTFAADAAGGLTVAIIALPLAMALGIASIPANVAADMQAVHPWLSPPAMGLFTAVVAGVLISALGGSRVQIGGPTAAFIPIVAGIAAEFGYGGLALATLMAGIIVILMGIFRFGAMIKFIPYPVTTGFTAGIAVTILASQLKDFFGLTVADAAGAPIPIPPDFIPKIALLAEHFGTINPYTTGVALGSLAVLIVMRKVLPRIPGAIVAVVLAAAVVKLMGWERGGELLGEGGVETIGSRFGSIPRSLPAPHLPAIDWSMVPDLIMPATTIALLCGIESLLSAVVADGMTGQRHKSDQELVAQGVANVGSVLFFGVPATGAIARTVANIKNGGKTPVSGILHALFILLFMFALADVTKMVPLASLSAILVIVAWNISEIDHFRSLLRAPKSDVAVLLTTFGLTVFTDLTIAVMVGMVLASFLFMKRMADVSNIASITKELENGEGEDTVGTHKDPTATARLAIPPGVEVYEIDGPFFFGVADRLKDTLGRLEKPPKVFILRMRKVPAIDASGLHAMEEFHYKCKRDGTRLLLSGVHAQPLVAFTRTGFDDLVGLNNMFETYEEALAEAWKVVGPPPPSARAGAEPPGPAI